jgi:hypothetical protein
LTKTRIRPATGALRRTPGPGWLTGGTASAAVAARPTPAAPGDAALRRLATQVAALPNDVGSGRYAFLQTETWGEQERPLDENGEVPAGVLPNHEYRTEWFADDHSGKWVADGTPRGGAPEHFEAMEPPLEPVGVGERRFSTLPTDDAAHAAAIREEALGGLPWLVSGDDGTEADAARYLATHEDPVPFLGLLAVSRQFADSDGEHQPRTPQERAASCGTWRRCPAPS